MGTKCTTDTAGTMATVQAETGLEVKTCLSLSDVFGVLGWVVLVTVLCLMVGFPGAKAV